MGKGAPEKVSIDEFDGYITCMYGNVITKLILFTMNMNE